MSISHADLARKWRADPYSEDREAGPACSIRQAGGTAIGIPMSGIAFATPTFSALPLPLSLENERMAHSEVLLRILSHLAQFSRELWGQSGSEQQAQKMVHSFANKWSDAWAAFLSSIFVVQSWASVLLVPFGLGFYLPVSEFDEYSSSSEKRDFR